MFYSNQHPSDVRAPQASKGAIMLLHNHGRFRYAYDFAMTVDKLSPASSCTSSNKEIMRQPFPPEGYLDSCLDGSGMGLEASDWNPTQRAYACFGLRSCR